MNYFEYKLFQFCVSQDILIPDKKYLLSISGGVDSVALFYLFLSFLEKIPIDFALVHFNHHVREESILDEQFVIQLAHEHKKKIYTVQAKEKFNTLSNFQNNARNWRHGELIKIKSQDAFDYIVQAHHLNDLVETQLWKLSKGASIFGLNPIQVKKGCWLHPLIETPKQSLIDYLNKKNRVWCEDKSNLDTKYTRNRIRNQVVPLLSNQSEVAFLKKMLALAKESENLNIFFENSVLETPSNILEYHSVQRLPKLFAYELIHRYILSQCQIRVKRWHIKKIYQLIQKNIGGWKIDLNLQFQVMGEKNKVIFKKLN